MRGFRERTEHGLLGHTRTFWTFRVERYDDEGNQLTSTPVVMQGRSFRGFISDGNAVRVVARRRPGHDTKARRVYNLTTDSEVVVHGYGLPFAVVAVLAVAVMAALAVGAYVIFQAVRDRAPNLDATRTGVNSIPGAPMAPSSTGAPQGSSGGAANPKETTNRQGQIPGASGATDTPAPTPAAVQVTDCVPPNVQVTVLPTGAYDVGKLVVPVGSTVTWVSTGGESTVAFDGNRLPPVSSEQGAPAVTTFQQTGEFPYSCLIADTKFRGSVVVGN